MKRVVALLGLASLVAAFGMAQGPASFPAQPKSDFFDLSGPLEGVPVEEAEMALIAGGRPPSWSFDDDGNEPWNRRGRPIENGGRVSSSTGPREPLATAGGVTSAIHKGTDFAAPAGTQVLSAKLGIVTQSGVRQPLGGLVKVRNLDGSESEYIHVTALVKTGDVVNVGTPVALVGRTGAGEDGGTLSTGPHLHYGELDRLGKVVPTEKVTGRTSTSSIRVHDRGL